MLMRRSSAPQRVRLATAAISSETLSRASRRLSGFRSSAPPATDEQIAEINREIADFFGDSSEAAPARPDASPSSGAEVRRAKITRPPLYGAQAAPEDALRTATLKSADEATIRELRERVSFLERLVERLVGLKR